MSLILELPDEMCNNFNMIIRLDKARNLNKING